MKKIIILLFWIFALNIALYSQPKSYPKPKKTNKLLFYIQRNHNSNTIVYDANFNKNGNLIKDEPIVVYWRRFDEQGQKKELKSIEKWYAYGVDWEETETKNLYKIELVADDEHKFWLKQIAPFKAIILTKINKQTSILDHIYIQADSSGAWPTVEYIEVFGKNAKTKQKTYEKLIIE